MSLLKSSSEKVTSRTRGLKRPASGHLYFDLKDESAVMNGVCWKGVAARMAFRPEDGLEVIAADD